MRVLPEEAQTWQVVFDCIPHRLREHHVGKPHKIEVAQSLSEICSQTIPVYTLG